MQASVIHEDNATRKLAVEVPYDAMLPYFEEALAMYREEAQIEGFRKGKAPKDVIQKKFGNMIEAEALEVVVEDFYREALEATKTEAIAIGKIENMDYKKGQPLKFDVTVEIMPKYDVQNYKGLNLKREVHKITDEEVTGAFDRLRESYSTTKETDVIAAGNFATVDIQVLDESGTPLIGKKYEDRRIPLTRQFVGQDFIDGLIGAKTGDMRILDVAKRPPQEGEDIATIEKEKYQVTVRKIEEMQLPALDDEFAKDLGFETFELLKADMHKNLSERWEQESEQKFREALIDEIIKQNEIPAPEPLVDNSLQRIGRMIKERLKGQPVKDELIAERYRPSAIREVKWTLAKRKIIEQENLKVEDADIQAYREKTAKQNKVPLEQINVHFHTETEQRNFEDYLLEEKAAKLIADSAKVEEVPDMLSEEKK
ncbi:MAG TPA: trigger factor [bacterium]|nr:trigger factor [bacterium]HMW31796.1 trigger factor [bacterium]HMW36359.1 trigger factor [bacterium]HMY35968.1 trigger factor [bacterium]HMZ02942.1 trigger factor [bacterium]